MCNMAPYTVIGHAYSFGMFDFLSAIAVYKQKLYRIFASHIFSAFESEKIDVKRHGIFNIVCVFNVCNKVAVCIISTRNLPDMISGIFGILGYGYSRVIQRIEGISYAFVLCVCIWNIFIYDRVAYSNIKFLSRKVINVIITRGIKKIYKRKYRGTVIQIEFLFECLLRCAVYNNLIASDIKFKCRTVRGVK